jgi:hypothetical protein
MKQTAVEWLYLQLIKNPKTPWNDILQQAKQIEKEQQLAFFKAGHLYSGCEHGFQEYYNKTFKYEYDENTK